MKRLLILIFLASDLASAQPATDIYLFDLAGENGKLVLTNGTNITRHKGYDNQPYFHPSLPLVYYASANDSGRTDIKVYNWTTRETSSLTRTHDREYSPTVTPDGKFLSCILQLDNGAQNLVQYPINGGQPRELVWHLKVGYHAWGGEQRVLLFVLDDSVRNSLHNYHLDTNSDTVIAENIGRCLLRIPGQNAISFVQKLPGNRGVIKRFDLQTGVISTINNTLDGQDFLTFFADGSMLASDGIRFYTCSNLYQASWQPVEEGAGVPVLKGITRLALSADNRKLAVVVSE